MTPRWALCAILSAVLLSSSATMKARAQIVSAYAGKTGARTVSPGTAQAAGISTLPSLDAGALPSAVLSVPSVAPTPALLNARSAAARPDAPKAPLPPPLTGTRLLGVRGPGITRAHIEAVKDLVRRTGEAIVIHGSRQTGVSHHTGLPYGAQSDLDLGVIGEASNLLKIGPELWDGRIPNVSHGPMTIVSSIEDAVGRGHFVVAPEVVPLPGEFGALQRRAYRWRTDEQLTALARTARAPGEAFRFAVIGDAEPGRFWFARLLFNKPGIFMRLLERAHRSRPDFILQIGDMVSRGTVANFMKFFRDINLARILTPYLTVIGNHDRRSPHGITDDVVYRTAFGGTDYSFRRGGWRFVVVDSSAGRITPAQLQWLEGELDPSAPTVVFTHIPPAPLSEWTDWGPLKGVGGFLEGSAEFMRLMSANKVSRVYMGHIHGLGTLERDGVKYVLTGGGGSPLFPGPKRRLHHWLSVEARPDGIFETVHADDGSTFPLR